MKNWWIKWKPELWPDNPGDKGLMIIVYVWIVIAIVAIFYSIWCICHGQVIVIGPR
jgi:hypothetical protein